MQIYFKFIENGDDICDSSGANYLNLNWYQFSIDLVPNPLGIFMFFSSSENWLRFLRTDLFLQNPLSLGLNYTRLEVKCTKYEKQFDDWKIIEKRHFCHEKCMFFRIEIHKNEECADFKRFSSLSFIQYPISQEEKREIQIYQTNQTIPWSRVSQIQLIILLNWAKSIAEMRKKNDLELQISMKYQDIRNMWQSEWIKSAESRC